MMLDTPKLCQDIPDGGNGHHGRYFEQNNTGKIVTDRVALIWAIPPHFSPIVTYNGDGVRKNRTRFDLAF